MFSKIIKSGLILCLCTAALAATTNAQESIPQHKRALIQELFTLTISSINVEGMIDVMLRQQEEEIPQRIERDLQENKDLTPLEREKMRQDLTEKSVRFSKRFRELLPQRINMKQEFEAIIFPLYDKYFTEDEIAQIVAFHKSPAGKKMMELMPQLIPEMMKKIQDAITPKMEMLFKEIRAEEEKNEKRADGEPVSTPEK